MVSILKNPILRTPETHMETTMEIHVPDIGDFKSVDVIEVLVKPGDSVAADHG